MAEDHPSNFDIMVKLGELSGAVSGILRELDNATAGRRVLYEKVEEQSASIKNVQFATEQQVQINAQTREEIKALHKEQSGMAESVKPLLDLKAELPAMVETWKDLRKSSQRLVWVLGLGGITTIGAIIWFGQQTTALIQHWLGIVPPA